MTLGVSDHVYQAAPRDEVLEGSQRLLVAAAVTS
jgi:hypothetical protein